MNKRILLIQLSNTASDLSSTLGENIDLTSEDRAFIENHLLMMRVAYAEWKGRNLEKTPVERHHTEDLRDDWRRFSVWTGARSEVRTFVEAAHELSSRENMPLSDQELEQLRDGLARMQRALEGNASGEGRHPGETLMIHQGEGPAGELKDGLERNGRSWKITHSRVVDLR